MRRGLTLIELLFVLAIVVLLAALLMPVIRIVRAQADSAACLGIIRQMQIANLQYAGEWRGRFVPLGFRIADGVTDFTNVWSNNRAFLQMATDGQLENGNIEVNRSINLLKRLVCPVVRKNTSLLAQTQSLGFKNILELAYGYNAQEDASNKRYVLIGPTVRTSRVSEHISFIDARGWYLYNSWEMTAYQNDEGRASGQTGGVTLRHRGRANMVLGDGSACSMPWDSRLKKYDSGLWNP